MKESYALVADAPLVSPEQDRLGRADFARFLAEAIVGANIEEGFVFALYGQWGTGKSSTLNFVRHYVEELPTVDERPIVVEFNPWWFSGREQLLQQFFHQVKASLGKPGWRHRFARWILRGVVRLPKALDVAARFVGLPEKVAIAIVRHLIGAYSDSIDRVDERGVASAERTELERALRALDRRILIVVDDIDRLPASEIRDMFRVIKAVADFPNTIYLLAFDRGVVAKALHDEGASGQRYLEKIVQAGFDLPMPERGQLRELLFEELSLALSGTPQDLWDETYWYNVYVEGVDGFIRTPRDIKRYLNVFRPSYSVVRGEVNATDFLAIEAVRVFAAPVYYEIRARPELFVGSTAASSWAETRLDARAKTAFEGVLDQVGTQRDRHAVHAMLKRLFPRYAQAFGGPLYGAEWAGKWRRQRRICSPDVFPVYFRLCVPVGALSKAEFDTLISLADDPVALTTQLRILASEPGSAARRSRAGEFLRQLPDATREHVPQDHIEGLIQALHDAGDDLMRGDERQAPYGIGNDMQVVGITHQLLRRITAKPKRCEILERVFRTAESIPLVVRQVDVLGQEHGKYAGLDAEKPEDDQLLTAECVEQLEAIVLERIEDAAESHALSNTPQLPKVLFHWQEWAGEAPAREYADQLIGSDEGLATLLAGFLSETYSQVFGDRIGRSSYFIQIPHVKTLVALDKCEQGARRILAQAPDWLTQRQRLAVQMFLRDLEQKPEGYGRLDSPD